MARIVQKKTAVKQIHAIATIQIPRRLKLILEEVETYVDEISPARMNEVMNEMAEVGNSLKKILDEI